MTGVIGLLFSKFKGVVVAVFMTVATVLGLYFAGRNAGHTAAVKDDEVEELNEYRQTRERIDEVQPSTDRDAAIARLRANGTIR